MTLSKLLYCIAVCIFIVNMLYGWLAKRKADATGDQARMAHMYRGLKRRDLYLTIPLMLLILAINPTVNEWKTMFGFHLDMVVFSMLAYATLVYVLVVHPLRNRLHQMTLEPSLDIEAYKAVSGNWVIAGIAELAPLIVVLLYSLFV